MRPDYLFVVPAVVILLWSVLTIARQRSKQGLIEGAIWMLLGIGLLLQGLSPHLQISGRVVEVPVAYSGGTPRVQVELVEQERRMMAVSSICIIVSIIMLGIRHKSLLTGSAVTVTGER